MAAVLREVRVAEPGSDRGREGDLRERRPVHVRAGPLGIRDGALHEDRVVEVGRRVVVCGVQVGGHVHLRDAVLVGVLGRGLSKLGGGEGTERGLGNVDAVVGGVEETEREVVVVDHEGIPDADRDEAALGTEADPREAVVAFRDGVRGAPAAVVVRRAVRARVEGVVVVVEEVPARDVVDEAVAVVVGAVGEEGDQVLGVELARVAVRAGVRRDDPGVVVRCEDAVPVAIVLGERPSLLPGGGAAGDGQLARVQPDAPSELLPVPLDARVADGDVGRLLADRELPGEVGGDAGDLRLPDVRVPRIAVERRGAALVRREAEQAMLLLEHAARPGHAIHVRVVGLRLVEVGVVRRVGARVRVGRRPGEQARIGDDEGGGQHAQCERGEDGGAAHASLLLSLSPPCR